MIKNQKLAEQIIETMNIAIEASSELINYLNVEHLHEFQEVSTDLYLMLKSIQDISLQLKEEEPALNLPAASESVLTSLLRIINLSKNNLKRATHKIEFELIPLIEEMRIHFFYWGTAYPDPIRIQKYHEEDIHWLFENKYQTKSEETGQYKYDLSINVCGYNKLEYTKHCIASLLKNLPTNLSYELILLNHGSTDGTKEFFESLKPDKQLDIAVNGGGSGAINRIFEGRYRINISNDVLVTPHALNNLYTCITSDAKIAWVVPSTPNVSNLQTISAQYNTLDDLYLFAEKNNISDPKRWEQRVRLCNPIDIVNGVFINTVKPSYRYHTPNQLSFPDDRQSLLCRRNGYKMYLAKDVFCHHFGSITLQEDNATNSHEAFFQGRQLFKETYGIDPWSLGMCYSHPLFQKLNCNKDGVPICILGIECGLGSNPLKIKESLKENANNFNVFLKLATSDSALINDLKGISDEVELFQSVHNLSETKDKYNYIIAENIINKTCTLTEYIALFSSLLTKDGITILSLSKQLGDDIKHDATYFTEYSSVEYVSDTYEQHEYYRLILYK